MQYKHFVEINEDREIIDAWCSAFREEEGLLLRETDYRKLFFDINKHI